MGYFKELDIELLELESAPPYQLPFDSESDILLLDGSEDFVFDFEFMASEFRDAASVDAGYSQPLFLVPMS